MADQVNPDPAVLARLDPDGRMAASRPRPRVADA